MTYTARLGRQAGQAPGPGAAALWAFLGAALF